MTATQQQTAYGTAEWAAGLLGVSVQAEEQVTRAAYRKAVREAHPDTGGSVEQLTAVRDAYATLQRYRGTPRPLVSVTVQRGAVVWVRSLIRPRLLGLAVAFSTALIAVAAVLASAAFTALAVSVAVVMLGAAVHVALGRKAPAPWRWEVRRRPKHRPASPEATTQPIPVVAEEVTGPIPRMTDERMRQYERTGR